MSKYDDAFNPRAFGDLMATRGSSTVLIESGALPDDAVARTGGRVRDVGDLSAVAAVDTIDASGLFLHVRSEAITGGVLPLGARAAIDVRSGAAADSPLRRQLDRDKGAQ